MRSGPATSYFPQQFRIRRFHEEETQTAGDASSDEHLQHQPFLEHELLSDRIGFKDVRPFEEEPETCPHDEGCAELADIGASDGHHAGVFLNRVGVVWFI